MSGEPTLPAPGFYWARWGKRLEPVKVDEHGIVLIIGETATLPLDDFEIGGALPPPAD